MVAMLRSFSSFGQHDHNSSELAGGQRLAHAADRDPHAVDAARARPQREPVGPVPGAVDRAPGHHALAADDGDRHGRGAREPVGDAQRRALAAAEHGPLELVGAQQLTVAAAVVAGDLLEAPVLLAQHDPADVLAGHREADEVETVAPAAAPRGGLREARDAALAHDPPALGDLEDLDLHGARAPA